ncbi:MAG: hypothetical protein OJF49_003244 [Ktedonobacterales bacterium]|jgi:hypothetical protein|nr:MAG: hypothetical protein OJF49_003244 [Ktedonobacterales bacterium]
MNQPPFEQPPHPQTPPPAPPAPPAPPQHRSLFGWFRSASRPLQIGIGCVALLTVCVVCSGVAAAISSAGSNGGNSVGQTATSPHTPASTATPKPTPTPRIVHYPPTTLDDLRGLAAQGNASAIQTVHSESVGLVGVCPQPKREVIVDPSVTGQQLAEDLLAYFYGQQLDSPCGSIVFAYYHQNEVGDVYTAGRINLDVNDSNGQGNIDPNATNLTYTLTLDIGGAMTNQQEYIVTYSG